jgi:arsenate reductase (thioredoxin)
MGVRMNRFSNAIVAASLVLAASTVAGQEPPASKAKVVFVCEHGAAKSVMAAAEFQRLATERGLSFWVLARGTNIDPELAASIVKGLRADGLAPTVDKPIKLDAKEIAGAAKVISFGPELSSVLPKGMQALDWSATPSPGKDYEVARDYIRREIANLISDLERAMPPPQGNNK